MTEIRHHKKICAIDDCGSQMLTKFAVTFTNWKSRGCRNNKKKKKKKFLSQFFGALI